MRSLDTIDRGLVAEWGKLNEELGRIARTLGEWQERGQKVKAALDAMQARLKADYDLADGDLFEQDLLSEQCGVIQRAPRPPEAKAEAEAPKDLGGDAKNQ